MAGLVKLDKFAPSQRPYAFHPGTFRINQHGLTIVQAVWAGRKNGRTTASIGTLWAHGPKTYDEFIETVDMRYGGNSEGKWDGETLVVPTPPSPSQHNTLVSQLQTALAQFPNMPFPQYEGWYYRR